MCERGILPVSPSSNSTVMRSPSSSRPSKPVGGGQGQGRPVAWAPWQTRGRGSRHQPASSPRPRTHEGRWAVEQDVGFAPGRPRTVGSPGPGRHVHPSRALPRVTTTSVGPHSRGSRPQDGGCNNAGLSEDDTRVDERDPSGLGPLCHREGSQLSKGSPGVPSPERRTPLQVCGQTGQTGGHTAVASFMPGHWAQQRRVVGTTPTRATVKSKPWMVTPSPTPRCRTRSPGPEGWRHRQAGGRGAASAGSWHPPLSGPAHTQLPVPLLSIASDERTASSRREQKDREVQTGARRKRGGGLQKETELKKPKMETVCPQGKEESTEQKEITEKRKNQRIRKNF